MLLTICLELFQIHSKVHSRDAWSGQTTWSSLQALEGTYVYLGKECGWKHELYSLIMSHLHGSGKLEKICFLWKICRI